MMRDPKDSWLIFGYLLPILLILALEARTRIGNEPLDDFAQPILKEQNQLPLLDANVFISRLDFKAVAVSSSDLLDDL